MLEQLLSSPDCSEFEQQAIVNRINPIIGKLKHVMLVPHHARNTWMVIHDLYGKKSKSWLELYTTESADSFTKFFFDDVDRASIKKIFAKYKDPLHEIAFKPSLKPSKKENKFVFSVAYALCIAMDHNVSAFKNALRDGEDTTMIRKIIVDTLKNGQLPFHIGDANDIWSHR